MPPLSRSLWGWDFPNVLRVWRSTRTFRGHKFHLDTINECLNVCIHISWKRGWWVNTRLQYIYTHIHIYLYVFDGFGDLSIYRTIWMGSTRPNTLVPFENRWRLWRFHQLCGFISSFTWHIFDAQSRFSSWIFARSQAMCVLWQRSPGRQWRI